MADTEQPELTLERFRALVEAYGGELERFPVRERAAARELLLRSDPARQLVEAARTFDQVLAEARADSAVTPSHALLERLARIPAQHPQHTPVLRLLPFHSPRQTWLLAAAALLLGMLGGGYDAVSSPGIAAVDAAQVENASLTFADDLFDDLSVQEGAQQ
jgi:hypothetical protein